MKIRKYNSQDCAEITQLFYDTIHSVNAKDYSPEQLDAWADGNADKVAWDKSLKEHHSLVALKNNQIVGFGDMDASGYFDRLYIHKDFQGLGIAGELADELETWARSQGLTRSYTHASITAKGFFEKRGYRLLAEHEVPRKGLKLKNFIMEKHLN